MFSRSTLLLRSQLNIFIVEHNLKNVRYGAMETNGNLWSWNTLHRVRLRVRDQLQGYNYLTLAMALTLGRIFKDHKFPSVSMEPCLIMTSVRGISVYLQIMRPLTRYTYERVIHRSPLNYEMKMILLEKRITVHSETDIGISINNCLFTSIFISLFIVTIALYDSEISVIHFHI